MTIKSILKKWLPPILQYQLVGLLKRDIYFSGQYADWDEASEKASGYDSGIILERVKQATLKVKSGDAVFERDSVLFDEVQYSFPVLAGLLRAAVENNNQLSVLDFGGSLGSSYYQCRNFLSALSSLEWNIVEQGHFVQTGKEFFENEELRFFCNIQECLAQTTPSVVLLSSVLQYLPDPYQVLEDLIKSNIDHLILDCTIVNNSLINRIYVQNVSENIYTASYPCFSLSEEKLKACFKNHYELISCFPSIEFNSLATIDSTFKGFIYKRIEK